MSLVLRTAGGVYDTTSNVVPELEQQRPLLSSETLLDLCNFVVEMGLTGRSRAIQAIVTTFLFFVLLSAFCHVSTQRLPQELPRSGPYQTAATRSPRPHNPSRAKFKSSEAVQVSLKTEQVPTSIKAAFISLVRNRELEGMLNSIHDIETRFNRYHHYDWVFLNDEDFTQDFKIATTAATSGRAKYGKINVQHWSYPSGLDQQFAESERQDLDARGDIPYAASESYRHMCRYQSGFFYQHPLVVEYDWYWRVEPDIELLCDVPYDPFKFMAENGKKYGFVISFNEISGTVPSLWTHVKAFMRDYPQHISKNNHLSFISEDGGETSNYCHFWDNFEIASLEWFRGEAYNDFFTYLDQSGGFFYERWGDASVHSIAAALMLDKGEIHFFDDVGYHHAPLKSCPRSASKRAELNCHCGAKDNLDWSPSCTKRFFEVTGLEFPPGHDRSVPREPGVLR